MDILERFASVYTVSELVFVDGAIRMLDAVMLFARVDAANMLLFVI